jgi:hypothetical protein
MDEDALAALIEGEDATAAPEPQAASESLEGGPDGGVVAPEPKEDADRRSAVREEPAEVGRGAAQAGHVPISAMLDERERRQAAERRLAEVEARLAPAAPLAPEQAQQAQLWALRMDLSRELVVGKHGEAEADALQQWGVARCDADPAFNAQVYQSRNPYEFIRQARQREQLLAEVSPEDLDDYRAWKAGRTAGASPEPAAPAAAPLSPSPPPRSLADAPNAGGSGAQAQIPIGPGAAFAQTIRR